MFKVGDRIIVGGQNAFTGYKGRIEKVDEHHNFLILDDLTEIWAMNHVLSLDLLFYNNLLIKSYFGIKDEF